MEQFWDLYQAYEQSLRQKHEQSHGCKQGNACMTARTPSDSTSNFGCGQSDKRSLLKDLLRSIPFKDITTSSLRYMLIDMR